MKMTSMNLTTIIKKSTVKEISKDWLEGVCMMSSTKNLENNRVIFPKNFEKTVNTEDGVGLKIPSYILGGYFEQK